MTCLHAFLQQDRLRGNVAMKKTASLCVFVLVLFFFVGTLLDFGYYCFFGPGLWHPSIACDNPIQDLGKLSDDKPVPCEFVIKNTGRQPLIIKKAKPSCGSCIKVVSFPQEPILPDEDGILHATLLVKRLKKGPVKKTLAIFSNDPQQPVFILRVQADIKKAPKEKAKTDDIPKGSVSLGMRKGKKINGSELSRSII